MKQLAGNVWVRRGCALVKRRPEVSRLFDDVQCLPGHEAPRTSRLCDQWQKVTRKIAERISI